MDFKQAEHRFKQLKALFEAETLTEAEFKAQLEKLMIQDEQGSWWMIGYETELWYRHDGTNWVQTEPPGSPKRKPTLLPSSSKIGNKRVENVASQPSSYRGTEKTADAPKNNIINWLESNKTFLLSWKGRSVVGGVIGIILGIIAYLAGSYPALILVVLIACGLAGLITYPHGSSIMFLLIGFFFAPAIVRAYNTQEFILIGTVLGFPAGALLSRILYWLKVIK